jgi:hypothetical protein
LEQAVKPRLTDLVLNRLITRKRLLGQEPRDNAQYLSNSARDFNARLRGRKTGSR